METDLLIKGGTVVLPNGEFVLDVAIRDGRISALGNFGANLNSKKVIPAFGLVVLPGIVDPHVHFREPGPNEEEDFFTGTRAAAAGGVTTVLEQPVDTPPTTTRKRFEEKLAIIKPRAFIDYGLWGGLIPENLDDLEDLSSAGACAFKAFVCSSDPIYPMVSDGVLLEAMKRIWGLGMLLAIHCENQSIIEYYDNKLKKAAYVKPIDHSRSRPEISEMEAIQRVILLAQESGVRLHILHLSSARGANLVKNARQWGLPVSVETCPHYLILTDQALNDYGPYAKCNPPLRDEANRQDLIRALKAGLIDCIVSDHSPYTSEAKACGLNDIRKAPPGINALELGLPLLIDKFVSPGVFSWGELARWLSGNPARLFGLYPKKGQIQIGSDADLVIVDPKHEWMVDTSLLQTKNKWSPYDGWHLKGKVLYTIVRGCAVYQEGDFPAGPGFGAFLNPSDNQSQGLEGELSRW